MSIENENRVAIAATSRFQGMAAQLLSRVASVRIERDAELNKRLAARKIENPLEDELATMQAVTQSMAEYDALQKERLTNLTAALNTATEAVNKILVGLNATS